MVAAQVALATLLLVCAGLMTNSFARVLRVESGLRSADVLTLAISLPKARYPEPGQWRDFFQQLEESLTVGILMITLVTLLAGLFPALRACRVDPVEALRYE